LEVNQSYDYNDTWTKSNSGVNGQPSIIYHAEFIAGQNGTKGLLPIGSGSIDGSNGEINSNLDYFTTAYKIIKNVYIKNETQNKLELIIEPGEYWQDKM